MDPLDKLCELPPITTHQAFVDFLALLHEEFLEHGSQWENDRLSRYLEAMHRWSNDVKEAYQNTGQAMPENAPNVPWQLFADILLAARVYE